MDIEAILMDRSSDDFYATFFDPSKTAPPRPQRGNNGSTAGSSATAAATSTTAASAPAAQQAAAPSGDVDPDRLARMRDRVRGVTSGESTSSESQATAPASSGMLNL